MRHLIKGWYARWGCVQVETIYVFRIGGLVHNPHWITSQHSTRQKNPNRDIVSALPLPTTCSVSPFMYQELLCSSPLTQILFSAPIEANCELSNAHIFVWRTMATLIELFGFLVNDSSIVNVKYASKRSRNFLSGALMKSSSQKVLWDYWGCPRCS